jgi:NAD(P)-dependent dehydrogenase (short-subunit alcohol dehydrogenase family)
MTEQGAGARSVLVVGGTAGLGRGVAQHFADLGWSVLLTGRDRDRAGKVAKEIGGDSRGLALDLSLPDQIAGALAEIDPVDHVVLAAIVRDDNTVHDYDIGSATYLAVMKIVGYTAVLNALAGRLSADGSVVMFGGRAKDRPYPGSTTVSAVNGAVDGLMRSLAVQLAPVRVNALHPGIVADTLYWANKPEAVDRVLAATPTGRNVTMADIVDAVDFLLRNPSVNGTDLSVDGGWLLQ